MCRRFQDGQFTIAGHMAGGLLCAGEGDVCCGGRMPTIGECGAFVASIAVAINSTVRSMVIGTVYHVIVPRLIDQWSSATATAGSYRRAERTVVRRIGHCHRERTKFKINNRTSNKNMRFEKIDRKKYQKSFCGWNMRHTKRNWHFFKK